MKKIKNYAKSVVKSNKGSTIFAAMMVERVKGHAAALLSACLFGLMSPMCKLIMQGGNMDGITLALLRVSGSALIFWIISLFVKNQKIRREDWPSLIAMSLCGIALNQFLYIGGVQYTVPTNASVTSTAIPVFTLLMAALFMGQHICFKRAVGIALACGGAVTMVLSSAGADEGQGAVIGDLMCLGSQVFAACYFVFFSQLISRYGVLTLMKWLFTISALVTWPLFSSHLTTVEWGVITQEEWMSLGYVVVIGTFVCYLVLNYAQGLLPAPVVASYNYIQPIVATTFTVVWGIGALTMQGVIAACLILVGVWMVSLTGTPKRALVRTAVRGRWIS